MLLFVFSAMKQHSCEGRCKARSPRRTMEIVIENLTINHKDSPLKGAPALCPWTAAVWDTVLLTIMLLSLSATVFDLHCTNRTMRAANGAPPQELVLSDSAANLTVLCWRRCFCLVALPRAKHPNTPATSILSPSHSSRPSNRIHLNVGRRPPAPIYVRSRCARRR